MHANDSSVFISDSLLGHPAGAWAITVEGGVIRAIERHAGSAGSPDVPSGAAVHDLCGKVVLPGLVDSHVHLIGTAIEAVTPSVRGIAALDELDRAILNARADTGYTSRDAGGAHRGLVHMMGLDLSGFPNRNAINAAHLESLVGDTPLMLKSIEGHSALFNTAAMAMLEVVPGMPGVETGVDGRPTGVVRGETYENLVDTLYDIFTADRVRITRGIDIAVSRAAARGCTGIHCLEGYGSDRRREFEFMLEYAKTCPLDLTLYPRTLDAEMVCALGLPRIGGCELIDGAIGSFTAALTQPYEGTDNLGCLYKTDEEVTSFFREAFAHGLQPCVHVIGDRGIDQCLRALELLSDEFGIARFRPRLDHFIVASDDLIARAARVGACAGVQPAFMAAWGARGGKYEGAIGARRWQMLHRYASMLAAGMSISAGSDSYITPIDPIAGLAAMVNHPNERERLDFDTAVRLHSEACAYLSMQESTRGKIAIGYEATFTVLESIEPIMENAPGEAKVAGVWIRGEKAV